MDFEKDDSLEVDAILERIKNKLSQRNSNHSYADYISSDSESDDVDDDVVPLSSGKQVQSENRTQFEKTYSATRNPQITKPLFLNDDVRSGSNPINVVDPNVIPNPFRRENLNSIDDVNTNVNHNSMRHNVVKSNPVVNKESQMFVQMTDIP
ncbi:MAG: hypothetical protein LBU68_00735, partial [Rickettsiales bacterium]|nr:hypothetical protein [Rickettsiales bacterium]